MKIDEQREALADKGWKAGKTFFEESGGHPADPAGDQPESDQGTGARGSDTSLPASEADDGAIQGDDHGATQSWPGSGGPGTIPPPG